VKLLINNISGILLGNLKRKHGTLDTVIIYRTGMIIDNMFGNPPIMVSDPYKLYVPFIFSPSSPSSVDNSNHQFQNPLLFCLFTIGLINRVFIRHNASKNPQTIIISTSRVPETKSIHFYQKTVI